MRTHVEGSRLRAGEVAAARRGRPAGGRLLAALFVLVAVVLLSALGAPARAAELSATQMKVSIWPEYDDPRVLVIEQGELDPGVQLPADITFNIPKGAEIGMACEVDPGGGHACKPYQLEDKGDYQALTYTVDTQKKVFFEYYYDAFPAGTAERAFDFDYRPGLPSANTTIEVQEPRRSTGFTVDPALARAATDSQGLVYHSQDFAGLPAGEPFVVKVSYTKSDAEPSVKPAEAGAAQPGGGLSATGGGSDNSTLFAVLAAVALGTLGFGAFRIMRPASASAGGRGGGGSRGPVRSRDVRPKSGPKRGANVRPARGAGGGSDGGTGKVAGRASGKRSGKAVSDTKFCTSCGMGIRRSDRFCPECGGEQD